MSAKAQFQNSCIQDWDKTQKQIYELRKQVGCSPEYNMKDCIANLGIGLGATAATGAIGAKVKRVYEEEIKNPKKFNKKPSSAGSCLLGAITIERPSFVDLILTKAQAGSFTCGIPNKDTFEIADDLDEVLKKRDKVIDDTLSWEKDATKRNTLMAEKREIQSIRNNLDNFPKTAEYLDRWMERAANIVHKSELPKLGGLRAQLLNVSPKVSLSSESSFVRRGIFALKEGKVFAKEGVKLVVKGVGVVAGGALSLAVSAATIEKLGCGELKGRYVELDEDCKPLKELRPAMAEFLMLDPEEQKKEIGQVDSLCAAVRQLHAKYYPSNVAGKCDGNSVQYRDNSLRFVETMTWNDSGDITSFKNSRYAGTWTDFTLNLDGTSIKSVSLKGRDTQRTIPASKMATTLTPGYDNEYVMQRFTDIRPRMLELSACCQKTLDATDPRCEIVRDSLIGKSSGGGSGSGATGAD